MFEGKDYVYEVYKTRSFTKAAVNLYISQPSLSATIKKIENRLGTPIFDRSTSPIRLTECGRKYISCLENLMDMEQDFENYLNDFDTLKTGHLSIGGSNLFASHILPPLISDFMGRYPFVEIKLAESSTHDLEEQLFAGNLDLVIDNYPFSEEIYVRHFFRREHLLLAVPSSFCSNLEYTSNALTAEDIRRGRHLDNSTGDTDLSRFQDEPFLLLRAGNDTRRRSELLFKNAGISPRVALKLDQQATAYHVSCYGMGISFVTDTLIEQMPTDPRISFYRLTGEAAERNIYFYHKRARYLTRAMEEFLRGSRTCPD